MGVNSVRLDDELYCQVGRELRESDMSTRASQGFGLSTRLICFFHGNVETRGVQLLSFIFCLVYLLALLWEEESKV